MRAQDFQKGDIIQLEKSTHQLVAPRIIRMVLLPGKKLEPHEVIKTRDLNAELAGNRPYYVLLILNEFSIPPAGTRNTISKPEFNPLLIGNAYVVNSMATRLAVNLFMTLNKPAVPIKVFNDEQKALEWLKKQVEKLP